MPDTDSECYILRYSPAAAAAAAAQAARDRAWTYNERVDPMTGDVARSAQVRSSNTISLDFPYQGAQHAGLIVRNDPSLGRDVVLFIERGQLQCPSYSGCRVTVRFDEGEPQTWRADGPSDNSSETIFLGNYVSFVRQLRAASVVRIRVDIYQGGSPVFEFPVAGYDDERVSPRSTARQR